VDVEDARPNGCRKGVAGSEGPRGRDKGSEEGLDPPDGGELLAVLKDKQKSGGKHQERAAVGTQMNCIHVPLRDVRV